MYVVAQTPTSGGIVTIKRAPLDQPIFPTGDGDPLISSADDPAVASPTSAKQNLTAAQPASSSSPRTTPPAATSTPRWTSVRPRSRPTSRPAARTGSPGPAHGTGRPPARQRRVRVVADGRAGQRLDGRRLERDRARRREGRPALPHASSPRRRPGSPRPARTSPQVGCDQAARGRALPSDGRAARARSGRSGSAVPAGRSWGCASPRTASSRFRWCREATPGYPSRRTDAGIVRALTSTSTGRSADLLLTNAAGKTIVKKTGLDWRTNEPGQPRKVCFQVSGTPAILDVDRVTVSR